MKSRDFPISGTRDDIAQAECMLIIYEQIWEGSMFHTVKKYLDSGVFLFLPVNQ